MPMSKTGNCECGAVGYSLTGDVDIYACHCLNCQTRSGSAFAEHAMVRAAQFDCRGATVVYSRTVDTVQFDEVFCSACYTRMFNKNSALPDMIFLRAGTISDSQRLEPIAHIWTKRKQSWLVVPDDIPAFEGSPTPEQFGAVVEAAHRRRSSDAASPCSLNTC
jgi:hypothetical protein